MAYRRGRSSKRLRAAGRRSPRWLGNLAVLCVTLLVCFIMLEIVVRSSRLAPSIGFPKGLIVLDPSLHFRAVPNYSGALRSPEFDTAVRTNSAGFRDDEWTAADATRTNRILVLGDSFTFGFGVEQNQTWTAQLQRELRAQGFDVRVINLGTPGYGTIQEERLLSSGVLDAYNPTLVVVAYFVGNDLNDNFRFDSLHFNVYHGLLFEGDITPIIKLKVIVAEYCRTCLVVYRLLTPHSSTRALFDAQTTDIDSRQFMPSYDASTDIAWNKTFAALRDMQAAAAQRHIPFELVLIPERQQLAPDLPAFVDIHKPATLMNAQLQTPSIDLLTLGLNSTEFYFMQDGHWNERGQSLAGSIVAHRLIADGVIH